MQILLSVVHAVQLLTAIAMIGLVLIQHGKGADMGASFGSGSSGSLFGATGSANFLSRSTAACATLFFICTLALAFLSNDRSSVASQGSILERASVVEPAASGASAVAPAAPSASGAAQIPATEAAASEAVAVPAPVASGAAAIPTK